MFSQDSSRVLTVGGTIANIFVIDKREALTFEESAETLMTATFSPDSSKIVTADIRGVARVWHADATGDALVLDSHRQRLLSSSQLLSASFSPDGTRVVTSSIDKPRAYGESPGRHS